MLNIKVLSYELILEVVYYEIEVKENEESWIINSRYSELKEVHDEFRKLNKKKGYPKFPPKKFFGGITPGFLDERQNALDTYFTNIIKYNIKLNYNLTPWKNFFHENKKEKAIKNDVKKVEKSSSLTEELSNLLGEIDKKESEANPIEDLNDAFRKKIIYVNNNLIESTKIRDNLFFIENEKIVNKDKKIEADDTKFLDDCLDFCSHFDEQFIFDEIETQKLFKKEFIFYF